MAVLSTGKATLTDDQKEELVKAHNFYRTKVNPIATNMAQLVRHSTRCTVLYSYTATLLRTTTACTAYLTSHFVHKDL